MTDEIRKDPNGFFYVRPAGKEHFSEVASSTLSKAQAHLAKLKQGLVQFKPYTPRTFDKSGFQSGFCNGAGPRNRLHQHL